MISGSQLAPWADRSARAPRGRGPSAARRETSGRRTPGLRYDRGFAAPRAQGFRHDPQQADRSRLPADRQGLAGEFPPRRGAGPDARPGQKSWCATIISRSTPTCAAGSSDARSYAKPQELGATMGGRNGRRGRRLEQSALQARRFRRRHGRLAALRPQRRARSHRRRRQEDSPSGLSRAGGHARRHRLVRPQQDHRPEGGRDGRRLRRDRRGRLGGRATCEDRRRARRRHRRRRRQMRLCDRANSATTPASTTSRRVSPRR